MEQARISTPQGTQSSQATRSRANAPHKGAEEELGASPGSFLALLAAQDPEITEGDPLAAAAGGGDAAGNLAQAPADPATLAALAAADSVAQQLRGQAGQNAAAAAQDGVTTVGLGQGGGARASLANALADPAGLSDGAAALAGRLLAGQGLPAADGLVSQTVALDGGAQGAMPQATATMAFGRQFSRMHSAALQRGGDAAVAGAGALPARAGGDAKQPLASTGDLSAVSSALAATVRELGVGPHRGAVGEGGTAGLDSPLVASQESMAIAGAPGARSADAGGGESSRHGGSGGLGESGAEPSFAVESASGTAGFEELAQTGAEELLAEQVTYWANQKTQSAEVTLNRDGQPLAVTVSLSGNEAHVTFRSDQEHTRDMLDQSMAQLSDLLRGEGLVLSGMTVGTSAGQGGASGDAGQQRNRPGEAQQGTVQVQAPTDVSQRLAGAGTRNSAVDVFV